MKKKVNNENYLERKPIGKNGLNWSKDDEGNVTLEMENKGVANRIMQKLIKKPKISYIHLDEIGSTVWKNIDGKRDIVFIGEILKEEFGEKIEPLYDRLVSYFDYLFKSGLITFKKAETVK